MNENKSNTQQAQLAKNNEKMIFIARKTPRSSAISFVSASIMMALIIATLVSFTPKLSGTFILGGVMAILMGLIVIQKPELGAYFLILTVFTNISDYLTDSGMPSVNRPLVALTYASIFVNYILQRGSSAKLPRISRVEGFLLAYFLTIVISLFVSPNNEGAFDLIIDITKDILTGFCLLLALNTKEKWRLGMWILIIVIANISFLGVIKVISGTSFTFAGLAQLSVIGQTDDSGLLRYGGPVGLPNIWAQVLASIVPIVIYRFWYEKNAFIKLNLLFATLLILTSVIYTGSRGAFIALVIIIPLMAIEQKVRIPTALPIILGFIILITVLPANYRERFQTLGLFFDTKNEYSLQQDSSFEGRRNEMLAGFAMFRANPFLGVGFGNYGINYYEYISDLGLSTSVGTIDPENLPKAHSLYVEVISETGLFGILTFSLFFGTMLIGIIRARARNKKNNRDPEWTNWLTALFFSILSFLVSGIFLHGILWRYIWMLIGFSLAAISLSESHLPKLDQSKTKSRIQ